MLKKSWTDKHIIIALSLLALAFCVFFLTYGAKGQWGFILSFRGVKILALVLIAIAIAVSTILFHTITHNRIITPAIMGFDALYVFIQTSLLFSLGTLEFINFGAIPKYLLNIAIMMALFLSLFHWLFLKANRSIFLLALTGIIIGIFFRNLSYFIFRLLDPNMFAVLQGELFSSFNAVETDLLSISVVIIALCLVPIYFMRYKLDILALGRDKAIALGISYKPNIFVLLAIIAVLVSVSTALVGPITFFGLLVSNLTYLIVKDQNHIHLLIVAC